MLIDYQKANVYQADDSVLNDVNFQVDADQFVYVIGKVGSGKSSLLKTIYCEVDFDKDDAEKAEVLGRNLLNIKRREIPALRREMGIILGLSAAARPQRVPQPRVCAALYGLEIVEADCRTHRAGARSRRYAGHEAAPAARAVGRRTATHSHRTRLAQQSEDYHRRRAYRKPRP